MLASEIWDAAWWEWRLPYKSLFAAGSTGRQAQNSVRSDAGNKLEMVIRPSAKTIKEKCVVRSTARSSQPGFLVSPVLVKPEFYKSQLSSSAK
jgi:hypothetical protein